MRTLHCSTIAAWLFLFSLSAAVRAQPTWQEYVAERTGEIAGRAHQDLASITPENWAGTQQAWRDELKEMLGLAPWPEKTNLKVTKVGTIALDGVTVERLHYQSRPGLYVAANLYLPTTPVPEAGWPAVLYVCGHARVAEYGRLYGNKTSYQHHGLWFARHGVACLMIDTVQLGEFHGEHHGTYKLGRWDWYSRGFTPGGVEAWNAIRGVDLLVDHPQVDGDKIGITGRSGGGAYSWFAAALDERIRVAVPVAGITDLQNHVVDGCVEGHCDCMYFVNYFGWDYAKLAALIAPRPLLLANSDSDGIFPLDGVMRIHVQLAELYRKLGASDNYGVLITPGPHKDTQELQVGAFKWLLKNLKAEEPVIDSAAVKELPVEELRVFEREVPKNEQVTSVSSWFVPEASSKSKESDAGEETNLNAETVRKWLAALRRLKTFPATSQQSFAKLNGSSSEIGDWQLWGGDNAGGIRILQLGTLTDAPPMVHLVTTAGEWKAERDVLTELKQQLPWLQRYPDRTHYFVRWRGANWLEDTSSVKKKHMIARRLYLLGESLEGIMLADFLSAAEWIAEQAKETTGAAEHGIDLAGEGRGAALVELAGLVASQSDSLTIKKLHLANRTSDPLLAPSLLGILRVASFTDLHTAASRLMDVEELSFESSQSPLLVDTTSEPQQASGMRIVEVDQSSARIWVRATRWPLPNLGDLPMVQFEKPASGSSKKNQFPILPEQGVDGLRFAVPGVAAQVRVSYRMRGGGWRQSEWQNVDASTDYSALIDIHDLEPNKTCEVRTQVRRSDADGDAPASASLSGSFQTLPAVDSTAEFRLAVGTCQAFNDRDGPHGFDVYRTMQARNTNAFVMAGDVVYYDQLARSNELAYYHWQRTYSLPTLIEFHKRVPTYFLKDDHDTYVNDTWPGTSLAWTGAFTFEDGQRIFKQQTGLPAQGYRTFQISRDLQIWLMEGRDYRSPNNAPDGPEKSIWGAAQKEWLRQTMDSSTAKFRVVISPTPIVGPDRNNKSDNHSNQVFAVEGQAVRELLASYPNTVSVCGDRHWQFHSIDPQTGLHEFSVGPVSDRHAGGWKQEDFRPEIHQFLRVAGGYLEIELSSDDDTPSLHLRHLDVQGNEKHSHTLQ